MGVLEQREVHQDETKVEIEIGILEKTYVPKRGRKARGKGDQKVVNSTRRGRVFRSTQTCLVPLVNADAGSLVAGFSWPWWRVDGSPGREDRDSRGGGRGLDVDAGAVRVRCGAPRCQQVCDCPDDGYICMMVRRSAWTGCRDLGV